MSKRKQSKNAAAGTGETPAADALTVVWMLTVIVTLVTEIGAALTIWYFNRHPDVTWVGALGGVLYFTAVVAAVVSLVLLGVVYAARRAPPPLPVTLFSLLVAAGPLLAAAIAMFR
jgi:hypothetical protein